MYWSGRWESNPRHSAWEADVLPLNYARVLFSIAKRIGAPQGNTGWVERSETHRLGGDCLKDDGFAALYPRAFGVLTRIKIRLLDAARPTCVAKTDRGRCRARLTVPLSRSRPGILDQPSALLGCPQFGPCCRNPIHASAPIAPPTKCEFKRMRGSSAKGKKGPAFAHRRLGGAYSQPNLIGGAYSISSEGVMWGGQVAIDTGKIGDAIGGGVPSALARTALAPRVVTRAYLMSGFADLGSGAMSAMGAKMRAHEVIVRSGATSRRILPADTSAHRTDRIIIVGYSMGVTAGARLANAARTCGVRFHPPVRHRPPGTDAAVSGCQRHEFCRRIATGLSGARNMEVPGYDRAGIIDNPRMQARFVGAALY